MVSHGALVRVPAAKAGGPWFDSPQLPWVFFRLPESPAAINAYKQEEGSMML